MSDSQRGEIDRRRFLSYAAGAAIGVASGVRLSPAAAAAPDPKTILSHNNQMEYRRLGKTEMWVSAVCLGGHWKRLQVAGASSGWDLPAQEARDAFLANRTEIVSKCLDVGINYVDACSSGEILAYAHALRGRRDRMHLGFSWYENELRFPEWRTKAKLLEGFDNGLRESGLEYADVWRVTALMNEPNADQDLEAVVGAFETLQAQGKARFLGLSSHHHEFLKHVIETWPQVSVILFPYTAASKELPQDSLFDAVRKQDVGVFGIKPFSSNSLFKGDSQPGSPTADQDNELARLTLRYILGNRAITAPIPGLIHPHQVDNVVRAVQERRELDGEEKGKLGRAAAEMTAALPQEYQWLRQWERV